ncbi:MAG: signal peptidase I [Phycisphaeraceae bacterium]|nr:signal peptidase I [Phycisphaeraceae bacterium]
MPSDTKAEKNGKKRAAKARPRWARRGLGKFAYDWLVPLAVAFAVLTPLRSSLADWHDVPSGSMRPTILEGDRIWVNKLAFGLRVPFTHTWVATWDAPDRGDIVTLASPADGTRLVKRIVGLPGDVVAMAGNRLTINGEALEYRVVDEGVLEPVPGQAASVHALHVQETLGGVNHMLTIVPTAQSAHTFEAMTIPAGRYLVLGDNRDLSGDSRVFGLVEAAAIEGRVGGVAFSLDPGRMYWPRFERWGLRLR